VGGGGKIEEPKPGGNQSVRSKKNSECETRCVAVEARWAISGPAVRLIRSASPAL